MPVERFDVIERSLGPADDRGRHGSYEVVRGELTYALDPAAPGSARVADIDLAPVGDDGMVRFAGDLQLVVPADRDAWNGGLLYVVSNRASAAMLPFDTETADRDLAGAFAPGDGWALGQGWAVAWSGWQWDVARGGNGVGLTVPHPTTAVDGRARAMFRVGLETDRHPLQESLLPGVEPPSVPYPVAADGDPEAVMTMRRGFTGEAAVVPRSDWDFSEDRIAVEMPAGFEPGAIYEVHYRTDHAPVAGLGLVAVRDAVSWLRYESVELVPDRVDRSVAFGSSQSGRFLRQFLHDAMNADDSSRPVFDGVFCHVAGSRRGEFNHRYASPGVTWTMGEGSRGPFGTADLLDRQREAGCVPKLFSVSSSAEYWRGDAALCHLDPVARRDLEDPPEARHYMFVGDHFGAMAIADLIEAVHPPAGTDAGLVARALFTALDRWVATGAAPPESVVPRLSDATAVLRAEQRRWFADRGVAVPDEAGLHPAALEGDLDVFVSAVDESGREIGGIVSPAVAALRGAVTGWNVYRSLGYDEVRIAPEFLGSRLAGDGGAGDPAEVAAAVADELVENGLLLASDRDLAVAQAVEASRG